MVCTVKRLVSSDNKDIGIVGSTESKVEVKLVAKIFVQHFIIGY